MNSSITPGERQLSAIDQWIVRFDRRLRQLGNEPVGAARPSPAAAFDENPAAALDENPAATAATADAASSTQGRQHIAGLMRINHTGEVCAQALYRGQALAARDPATREAMQESAAEEQDHLAWCEERLAQLGAKPSLLNPAFYAMSFGIGALAGAAGDRFSLGFIAATEDQVCEHLREHLEQVPESDRKTRAILQQMLEDEAAHGNKALAAGGVIFHDAAKRVMRLMSKVMTQATYRI